jgi:phosphoribosylaminoimidazole (AIR) synthetase
MCLKQILVNQKNRRKKELMLKKGRFALIFSLFLSNGNITFCYMFRFFNMGFWRFSALIKHF